MTALSEIVGVYQYQLLSCCCQLSLTISVNINQVNSTAQRILTNFNEF